MKVISPPKWSLFFQTKFIFCPLNTINYVYSETIWHLSIVIFLSYFEPWWKEKFTVKDAHGVQNNDKKTQAWNSSKDTDLKFCTKVLYVKLCDCAKFCAISSIWARVMGGKGVLGANFPKHVKYSSFITRTFLVIDRLTAVTTGDPARGFEWSSNLRSLWIYHLLQDSLTL